MAPHCAARLVRLLLRIACCYAFSPYQHAGLLASGAALDMCHQALQWSAGDWPQNVHPDPPLLCDCCAGTHSPSQARPCRLRPSSRWLPAAAKEARPMPARSVTGPALPEVGMMQGGGYKPAACSRTASSSHPPGTAVATSALRDPRKAAHSGRW